MAISGSDHPFWTANAPFSASRLDLPDPQLRRLARGRPHRTRVAMIWLWNNWTCSWTLGSPSILIPAQLSTRGIGEGHEQVAEARRREVVLDPALPIVRRAGDAEGFADFR